MRRLFALFFVVSLVLCVGTDTEAQPGKKRPKPPQPPKPAERHAHIAVRGANGGSLNVISYLGDDGNVVRTQAYGAGPSESQYLMGDWNGDGHSKPAVRRGNAVFMDLNYDSSHDIVRSFGLGPAETTYIAGRWAGSASDKLAVVRGNCVIYDADVARPGNQQCFGNTGDTYLAGRWRKNQPPTIAVKRAENGRDCIYFSDSYAATVATERVCYTWPPGTYLTGDFNGDGVDDIAVVNNGVVLIDTSRKGSQDKQIQVPVGVQYFVGYW
jgi:hypothetical protein